MKGDEADGCGTDLNALEQVERRAQIIGQTGAQHIREDREWGEVVVAYVVRRGNEAPDAGELDTFCLERLARFKRPRHYRFIARLPKNEYGKVPKTALRELEASRHRAGADSTRLE
jgi:acyl-CoA synthetase (AMP-forming)/AMP-acid ligase II